MKELKYYESSKEATLFSFRNVIETGDVRYLLILDDYKELPDIETSKLEEAWDNIYQEYSEIVEDSSAELRFAEQKRLLVKQHKIGYISNMLSLITKIPDQEIIELINEEGYNINTEDFEKFLASIKKAIAKLKREKLLLKRNEPKDEDEKQNFDILITELEKFQGYAFDESMSVSKFAAIIKRYKDYGRQDQKK